MCMCGILGVTQHEIVFFPLPVIISFPSILFFFFLRMADNFFSGPPEHWRIIHFFVTPVSKFFVFIFWHVRPYCLCQYYMVFMLALLTVPEIVADLT